MNKTKYKDTEIGKIPDDWEVVTIPDVASNFDNRRKPLSSAERSKIKGPYPYYGAAGIIDYVNGYKYDGDYLLIAEDGTVTCDGSKPMLQLPRGKFWVSNHAHVLQSESYNDTLFLYYQLKNTPVNAFITGAVQPKLSQENLNKIRFPWAKNDKERGAITKILSDLDDKIELNHQMNKTLESIAQAIFKRWFVDFEFPDEKGKPYKSSGGKMVDSELGEIPAGWQIDRLAEVADVNWGDTNTTKASYIGEGFDAYSASGLDGKMDHYDYDSPGIILSAIGAYCGQTWLAYGKWSCIKNTIRILAKTERASIEYIYFTTHNKDYWPRRGSAQPFVSQTDARNQLIIISSDTMMINFSNLTRNFLQAIDDNLRQAITLSQIRDSLLPRLMSGKMRVLLEERG